MRSWREQRCERRGAGPPSRPCSSGVLKMTRPGGPVRHAGAVHAPRTACGSGARARDRCGSFLTGPSVTAVRTRGSLVRGIGWLRGSVESAGLNIGPVGSWVYAHKQALRIGAVAAAGLALVFWGSPPGRSSSCWPCCSWSCWASSSSSDGHPRRALAPRPHKPEPSGGGQAGPASRRPCARSITTSMSAISYSRVRRCTIVPE